jgi:hypothetical protein
VHTLDLLGLVCGLFGVGLLIVAYALACKRESKRQLQETAIPRNGSIIVGFYGIVLSRVMHHTSWHTVALALPLA